VRSFVAGLKSELAAQLGTEAATFDQFAAYCLDLLRSVSNSAALTHECVIQLFCGFADLHAAPTSSSAART
jgi:hypothetical protein